MHWDHGNRLSESSNSHLKFIILTSLGHYTLFEEKVGVTEIRKVIVSTLKSFEQSVLLFISAMKLKERLREFW